MQFYLLSVRLSAATVAGFFSLKFLFLFGFWLWFKATQPFETANQTQFKEKET